MAMGSTSTRDGERGQAEPIVVFGQVPHQHCSQMRCGFLVGHLAMA